MRADFGWIDQLEADCRLFGVSNCVPQSLFSCDCSAPLLLSCVLSHRPIRQQHCYVCDRHPLQKVRSFRDISGLRSPMRCEWQLRKLILKRTSRSIQRKPEPLQNPIPGRGICMHCRDFFSQLKPPEALLLIPHIQSRATL